MVARTNVAQKARRYFYGYPRDHFSHNPWNGERYPVTQKSRHSDYVSPPKNSTCRQTHGKDKGSGSEVVGEASPPKSHEIPRTEIPVCVFERGEKTRERKA